MRRALIVSAALAGFTAVAGAQQPAGGIKLADVAGVWDSKTMVGPKDSVVLADVVTVTADGHWTIGFQGRKDAVPMRVVATGGDSIVVEAGPFPSALRPGATVKLMHEVGHYKGNEMWGTFTATYDKGPDVSGKVSATRRK